MNKINGFPLTACKHNPAWYSWVVIAILAGSCDLIKPDKSEVRILTDDSTLLSTDVYIPNRWGKYPTVLIRTPYDKKNDAWAGDAFGIMGIAVVIQDVRGKYESGGTFYPFLNEREDGLKTLEWIRSQPWSNGIVGGWGTSYLGYTQWAVSDSLDFLVPLLTGADIYDLVYPGGLFSLQTAFSWGFENASQTTNRMTPDQLSKSYGILPLSSADDSVIHDISYINDWIAHPSNDDYWQMMNHRGMDGPPVLSIGGWYDIFLLAQLQDFNALPSKIRPDSHIIIGPWGHGAQGVKNDYGGIKKTGNPRKIFSYTVKYLKGKRKKLPSPLTDKKFNLFIMERNEYFGSDHWPPEQTVMTSFYLGSETRLSPGTSEINDSVTYIYDPRDPFPSFGGTVLGEKTGPAIQNPNLSRTDQAVFETNVLDSALILLGPVSATIWVKSSAECTDLIISLQDVFSDGQVINIQEGGGQIRFAEKGPQKKEISVWATGYQLNPGHKLRMVISSALFPRFNRNLNNCQPASRAMHPEVAVETIYYGRKMPSCIHLPVLDLRKNSKF